MVRILEKYIYKTPTIITRNWENQFLGENNFSELNNYLLQSNFFNKIVNPKITKKYIDSFNRNPLKYAHSLSMLITLAVFSNRFSK